MSDLVTVKLRREVVEALKQVGRKGETYSDVIERLIEAVDKPKSPLKSQRDSGETTQGGRGNPS
jgi:predicted CopG family antitoxin